MMEGDDPMPIQNYSSFDHFNFVLLVTFRFFFVAVFLVSKQARTTQALIISIFLEEQYFQTIRACKYFE